MHYQSSILMKRHSKIKTVIVFTFLLITNIFFSQEKQIDKSTTISIIFQQKGVEEKSAVYPLNIGENTPFITVSAYILNTDIKTELFYRIQKSEQWQAWIPMLENTHDITPDRTVFNGGTVDYCTAIQFKSSNKVDEQVNFRIFIPSKNKGLATANLPNKNSISCSCSEPEICLRDCWCPGNNCPPDNTPTFTEPTHIIIHHSAGFTTSDDFAAVVSSYYDLHVYTNGWDDIGYNYLIDANGVIYEGRGNGVQGAHFSCMNTNTIGVCVIGNYMTVAPASGAMQSLMNFLAWESCEYDIEIAELSYFTLAEMEMNNVSAHRDGNESESPFSCASGTECPGDVLYGLIPTFIDLVSQYPCIQEPIDISEIATEDQLTIFPNPVINSINVKAAFLELGKEVIIEIFTIQGEKVFTKNETVTTNGGLELKEFDALESGTYFLQLKSGDVVFIKEFIKTN